MKLPTKTTAVTPHLTVRDVQAAAKFYEKAFGFTIEMMLPAKDGRVMHAELHHYPAGHIFARLGERPETTIIILSGHGAVYIDRDQGQVVRMRIYEEKKFIEIATELGLPLGTVLTRMQLALRKLKKLLDRDT